MSTALIELERSSIHATLHALSQPLTVVSLALSLAQSATSEAERSFALESAMTECQRAMESVRDLRSLVDRGIQAKSMATPTQTGIATRRQAIGGAA